MKDAVSVTLPSSQGPMAGGNNHPAPEGFLEEVVMYRILFRIPLIKTTTSTGKQRAVRSKTNLGGSDEVFG
jgi:hypothetical protein